LVPGATARLLCTAHGQRPAFWRFRGCTSGKKVANGDQLHRDRGSERVAGCDPFGFPSDRPSCGGCPGARYTTVTGATRGAGGTAAVGLSRSSPPRSTSMARSTRSVRVSGGSPNKLVVAVVRSGGMIVLMHTAIMVGGTGCCLQAWRWRTVAQAGLAGGSGMGGMPRPIGTN